MAIIGGKDELLTTKLLCEYPWQNVTKCESNYDI